MARFVTGKTFGTTETVTAALLNQAVNDAAISTDSVDGSTIEVNSNALRIKDNGVTAAKIAAGALTDVVYPVGAIFTTVTNYADSAAVVNAIGGTTWTAFGAGKVLVGVDASDTDFDTAEETGGAKTHTLDITEMPSHRHGGIQPAGSQGANANGFDVDSSVSGSSTDTKLTTYAGGAGSDTNGSLTSPGATQAHNNLQPYIVVYMWKRTA
jgi:microcystin-dependent protein